jgi:uncharacterized protein
VTDRTGAAWEEEFELPSKTVESAIDVAKAHMAAEDRKDVDATVATFTEDCYYRVMGLDVELRGKGEIRRWYEDLFAAIPDFRNSEERYWEAEGNVFFEALMEGTHLGTWHGWAPTGRSFRSPMFVRIPIAPDGLMEAEIVYNDSADVFTQLGILPRRGSVQERTLQAVHRLRQRLPVLR